MRVKLLQSCATLHPYGLYSARLLYLWDSPGKNTGVGCPAPPSGDLPDPGIELVSPTSPVLAGKFFTASPTWEAPIQGQPSLTLLFCHYKVIN